MVHPLPYRINDGLGLDGNETFEFGGATSWRMIFGESTLPPPTPRSIPHPDLPIAVTSVFSLFPKATRRSLSDRLTKEIIISIRFVLFSSHVRRTVAVIVVTQNRLISRDGFCDRRKRDKAARR